MEQAINLARKGEGYTSPNPMVGALVVKEGKIIGQGYHQQYGGPHAEVHALQEAGQAAEGATIYVTLEPCSHYGKTPPCAERVIKSGIKKAVIAMEDPNPIVAGRGIKKLQEAGIEVEVGLLKDEAVKLNEIFIKYITTDYPFVYLKTAQTTDGYLATKTGDAKWISNEMSRERGHQIRHKVDAILVGIGTVLSDDPRLTTRLPNQEGKDSMRVILDARLEIPTTAKVLNHDSPATTLIVTGEKVDKVKRTLVTAKQNVEILTLPLNSEGRIPLADLLRNLHSRGISSILVEGGGRVNHSFLHAGLGDRLYTFITPKILGGEDGVAPFSGPGPALMQDVKNLEDVSFEILGDNILLTGKL